MQYVLLRCLPKFLCCEQRIRGIKLHDTILGFKRHYIQLVKPDRRINQVSPKHTAGAYPPALWTSTLLYLDPGSVVLVFTFRASSDGDRLTVASFELFTSAPAGEKCSPPLTFGHWAKKRWGKRGCQWHHFKKREEAMASFLRTPYHDPQRHVN